MQIAGITNFGIFPLEGNSKPGELGRSAPNHLQIITDRPGLIVPAQPALQNTASTAG